MNASLTQLLALAAQGERSALDQVFTILYPELRAIARSRLRIDGRVAHLDTTSLVHESYLRLVNLSEISITDRKHFFTYAAKMMRNIAIDIAREHLAQRRGGALRSFRSTPRLENSSRRATPTRFSFACRMLCSRWTQSTLPWHRSLKCVTSPVTATLKSPICSDRRNAPCVVSGKRPVRFCSRR